MRKQYKLEDLRGGVRGKHFAGYSRGTNLILLSPDVAAVFPTADAVNDALRGLVEVAKKSVHLEVSAGGRSTKRKVA